MIDTKKRQCQICSNDKYIGFINYVTKENYRLCYNHYMKWLLSKDRVTIGAYILKTKYDETIEQRKLQ